MKWSHCFVLQERVAFKERIRADLIDHGIQVYPLQEHEDTDDSQENIKIRVRHILGEYDNKKVNVRDKSSLD